MVSHSKGSRFVQPLLFLLALLLPCAFQSATEADQEVDQTPIADQVALTKWAFRHIVERHWPDSSAAGAGKFQSGITEESLRVLINQAVQYGHGRTNTNGRPGLIYEYDFRHQIGTNVSGQPATRLRVVVNKRNQVITAFPY
jgi:hypothetical protein